MKDIEKRIAFLEEALSNDLKATVTFENGEKKRLSVLDTVHTAIHGRKGDTPKIVNIEWIGDDNGSNGILPQVAECLLREMNT